jgi:hypothetical protein
MPPDYKTKPHRGIDYSSDFPPERRHPCLSTCTCSSTPAFLTPRRQVWPLHVIGLRSATAFCCKEIAASAWMGFRTTTDRSNAGHQHLREHLNQLGLHVNEPEPAILRNSTSHTIKVEQFCGKGTGTVLKSF